MLLDLAILKNPPFDETVNKLLDLELFQIVDGSPRRALDFESVGNQLLMENMQMRGVDGIFHRLQPVAVELWQRAQPMPAIRARPHVVFGNDRHRLRSEISPIKTG